MDDVQVEMRALTSGRRIVSLGLDFTLWKIYSLIAIGVSSPFARWDTTRSSAMSAMKVST